MTRSAPDASRLGKTSARLIPGTMGVGAALLIAASVYSLAGQQPPGITSDEPFNVRQGIYLVESMRDYGLGLFSPDSMSEIFNSPLHLPDHPPLGRLAIGLAHAVFPHSDHDSTSDSQPDSAHGTGSDQLQISYPAARMASGLWFAATILVITRWVQAVISSRAAIGTGLILLTMPRLIGHAHLASLESCIGFWFTATVLHLARNWSTDTPGLRTACFTGLLLGLAFLSKIQAVLLLPPILVWITWRWRHRGIVPAAVMLLTALAVFVAGWPWLWPDIPGRTMAYFGRTTNRVPIQVWYFGRQWLDRDVPWHFPWVTLLATMPVVSVGLAFAGIRRHARTRATRSDSANPSNAVILQWSCRLLVLVVASVLLTFSWPGIAVYDSARLFLVVFPLLAVLTGMGLAGLLNWRQRWPARNAAIGLILIGLISLADVTLIIRQRPLSLSSYGLLVGGPRGAEALGMELDYWGESVTDELLSQIASHLPEGSVIDAVPVAHPVFVEELQERLRRISGRRLTVRPLDHRNWSNVNYIVCFRRQADLPWFLRRRQLPPGASVVCELSRNGVRMAALVRVKPEEINPDTPPE